LFGGHLAASGGTVTCRGRVSRIQDPHAHEDNELSMPASKCHHAATASNVDLPRDPSAD